ncbi:hypothetical protein LINGRAHAP2_LOCUS5790 [Linum grandiflorum]
MRNQFEYRTSEVEAVGGRERDFHEMRVFELAVAREVVNDGDSVSDFRRGEFCAVFIASHGIVVVVVTPDSESIRSGFSVAPFPRETKKVGVSSSGTDGHISGCFSFLRNDVAGRKQRLNRRCGKRRSREEGRKSRE